MNFGYMNAWSLSQFLHGEQGALLVASQLCSCAPPSTQNFTRPHRPLMKRGMLKFLISTFKAGSV